MWAGPTLFYREEHVGGTHLFLFLNLGAWSLELGAWSLELGAWSVLQYNQIEHTSVKQSI